MKIKIIILLFIILNRNLTAVFCNDIAYIIALIYNTKVIMFISKNLNNIKNIYIEIIKYL
jgi:hypothetical protein